MHRVRGPQLPHAEGNPGRQPAGAEEVLPQGAQAHDPQGVAEEVSDLSLVQSPLSLDRGPGTNRGVAQLVEHWSPKPAVERSSRSAPARNRGCGGRAGARTGAARGPSEQAG